jgi:hypothetical protein
MCDWHKWQLVRRKGAYEMACSECGAVRPASVGEVRCRVQARGDQGNKARRRLTYADYQAIRRQRRTA